MQKIDGLGVYDSFLKDVITSSDEFQEPNDIVIRFNTLKDSKKLLDTENLE